MLSYYNQSETCVVLLHEIYGINQHMKDIAKKLSEYQVDIICPNLLEIDGSYSYSDEQKVYQNFKENVGFAVGVEKVKKLLYQIRDEYEFIIVLGFSIGATIAWLCSDEQGLCDMIIGYYGSRIRDYTDVIPKCPTLLFFPENEISFDSIDLIGEIEVKRNVRVYQFQGKHGFSDPYSDKYCSNSAKRAEREMINFIRNSISLSG
ncbi:dienelactone hydrolase [Orenia metallireducens]|jgi:dienelactone hydrolase|uniref:Dienelactone hydrolase n=1 Tax=Orenia metallireducens TaxID=1413210 RepID=A0A285HNP8_9FIRM|nr:dienelactone hydrolase family protein [Orenia metallireducens]PRX27999.1 dienelactone hydrolase [Orenia metallireducens]SNY37360.1 Dienelactone hydrolase [Orenia metallireducens]